MDQDFFWNHEPLQGHSPWTPCFEEQTHFVLSRYGKSFFVSGKVFCKVHSNLWVYSQVNSMVPYRGGLFNSAIWKTGAFISHCAVLKVNCRNWFWQKLQSTSRTKLSGVAYAVVDLTGLKAAVQRTSYLSNLLDVSEAKINLDKRRF